MPGKACSSQFVFNVFALFAILFLFDSCRQYGGKLDVFADNKSDFIYKTIKQANAMIPSNMDSAVFFLSKLKNSDSLMDDTTQAFFNNTFGVYFWYNSEFDTAIMWFCKTMEIKQEDGLLPFKAEAANNAGTILGFTGYPDSAARYLELALTIDKTLKNERGINKTLYDLGLLYLRKNQYLLSLTYFFQLKEGLLLHPDEKLKLLFTTAFGSVFYHLDSLSQAVEYYEKSLRLAKEVKDTAQIKMAYNNLSAAYSKMPDKLDKALYYSKKGLNFAKGKESPTTALALNLNVAYAYCSKRMIDSALVWYKKASHFAPYIENPYLLSAFYIRWAEALFKDGQHVAAQDYYQKALDYSISGSSTENQRDALLGLAQVDSAAMNYLKAYDYYRQATSLDKMIYNKENSSRIAELNILHESALKERQIKFLQEKDRKNRLLRVSGILFTSILLVSLTLFFLYLRKRRKVAEQKMIITRQENETAMLKLDAIRKELTGKAYSLAKAEKLMGNLKSEIQELIPNTDVDTSQQLHSLTHLLRQNKNSLKLWHEFEQRFDELNDGFISKLAKQYHTLSSTELRLCAMLRLQLSNKEIAEITGRSVRTIEYTRLRIRRKMNLDEGANLSGHILKIG